MIGKQRGETCGACFNPQSGYDCGKCADGLFCQPGDPQLPDIPGTCVDNENWHRLHLLKQISISAI